MDPNQKGARFGRYTKYLQAIARTSEGAAAPPRALAAFQHELQARPVHRTAARCASCMQKCMRRACLRIALCGVCCSPRPNVRQKKNASVAL